MVTPTTGIEQRRTAEFAEADDDRSIQPALSGVTIWTTLEIFDHPRHNSETDRLTWSLVSFPIVEVGVESRAD